jgi:predicted 2-oxoglutarate/Fe(II)-dependent dioxygenase YbiX
MAKRLQVILQEPEYREIQRVARSRHMSIAEWVRQALAHARRREPLGDMDKKLKAIRDAAAQNAGSAADIETMLSEIEQGYRSTRP